MTVVAPETAEVEKTEVRCDDSSGGTSRNSSGGSYPLGYPTVYLSMGAKGWVESSYCDHKFVLKEGASALVH